MKLEFNQCYYAFDEDFLVRRGIVARANNCVIIVCACLVSSFLEDKF